MNVFIWPIYTQSENRKETCIYTIPEVHNICLNFQSHFHQRRTLFRIPKLVCLLKEYSEADVVQECCEPDHDSGRGRTIWERTKIGSPSRLNLISIRIVLYLQS